jgi:deoxycytidylate deaminase
MRYSCLSELPGVRGLRTVMVGQRCVQTSVNALHQFCVAVLLVSRIVSIVKKAIFCDMTPCDSCKK